MKNLSCFWLGVSAGLFTLLAIFLIDRPLSQYLHVSGMEGNSLFSLATTFLDTATGKLISKFLAGTIIMLSALALLVGQKTRKWGYRLLFAGSVQLLCTLITGLSKNLFGRLRPFELLTSNNWEEEWFKGGSSFPSGHAGYYWGLFLPFVLLFPRYRYALVVIPVFISIARIIANDHFLGDVTCSIAVSAFITYGMSTLFKDRDLIRK